MNTDQFEYENITIEEYLKSYNSETLLENEKIYDILEDNFKRNFISDCRYQIEMMKQKYMNLYSHSGIFKKDLNNANWERMFNIIYDNIDKNYDLGIIYNNPKFFIDILEK